MRYQRLQGGFFFWNTVVTAANYALGFGSKRVCRSFHRSLHRRCRKWAQGDGGLTDSGIRLEDITEVDDGIAISSSASVDADDLPNKLWQEHAFAVRTQVIFINPRLINSSF